MTDRDDIDVEAVRRRLRDKRAELEALAETNQEARETVDLDPVREGRLARMDSLQKQAMSQAADRRRKQEMQRIDAALARIDSGDYGYCARCDEPIGRKRLDVDPAAPLCIQCAEKAGS